MLTDERIREILGLVGMDDNDEVRSLSVIETITEARAIEQETTKPQEPVAWMWEFGHDEGAAFSTKAPTISIKDGVNYIPLFTAPQPCPECQSRANGSAVLVPSVELKKLQAKCADLEAQVISKQGKEDANNYCRILTLLGMEEEGSPVEAVERLISLRDGMTCGDCNDTGWLENREEGRYPCTCMTEAEPYQLLEAERDDWKSRYESNLSVNQMHSDNNAEMLKFTAKLLADIDALKKQNNAYATLTKAQEGRLVEYGSEKAKWLDAEAK